MKKIYSILCIGDSLTEAYALEREMSWTVLLGESLKTSTINCGISGDTTGGMLARLMQQLFIHEPSHLIIMGGTNDLWVQLPIPLILGNILAMTRQAKSCNVIPIIGIPPPAYCFENMESDGLLLGINSMCTKLQEYHKILMDFALEIDIEYIDFTQNMTEDLFMEDGIHPSEKGHIQMSKIAIQRLMKLL